ncbi:MAG: NUDIX domain-containing protein [Clostridiales bacterium]|nr:NUDIX domain-containing protein [Clostridiales bacterium]
MREEKSCGAIVFRQQDNQLEVLLLKHRAGHWDFPKGHMEAGESEQETALREVLEESGLTVHIDDTGFRRVIRYSPSRGISKQVVFFIARYVGGRLTPQHTEVDQAWWLDPKDALTLLTHQSSRDILSQAMRHLNEEIQ